MDLFSKLKVKEIPFEDENWEDYTIHGWMLFFLISIGFGVLISIASIYQDTNLASGLKDLLYIPCYYGIYAIITFVLRWKNAVFTSTIYLLQLIINNVTALILGIRSFEAATLSFSTIWCIILPIIWLVYLFMSHNIAVRFPKGQRKIFIFDWIAAVIVLGMALFNIGSVMYIKY